MGVRRAQQRVAWLASTRAALVVIGIIMWGLAIATAAADNLADLPGRTALIVMSAAIGTIGIAVALVGPATWARLWIGGAVMVYATIRGGAFATEVAVLRITVAALMTTEWIGKFLELPAGVDLVMLPGLVEGDAEALAAKLGVRVEKGPKDLRDIPAHFGRAARAVD